MLAFCSSVAHAKKNVIRAPGGTSFGQFGLLIDASYDSRLDTLVPGYKVINVVIGNESFNIIYLEPEKDRWSIKVRGRKTEVKAINNLRMQDPKAWSQLPERVQDIVGYPLVLPIGARVVFDLFIPSDIDLDKFNELVVFIKFLDTRFEVLVSQ